MTSKTFPVIDLVATGNNIRQLRLERGLTIRDLQLYFGFEEPRAIYKWQSGESLPSVDNLYALGNLLDVPMDQILVPLSLKLHMLKEQQAETCCSNLFLAGYRGYGKLKITSTIFVLCVRNGKPRLPQSHDATNRCISLTKAVNISFF